MARENLSLNVENFFIDRLHKKSLNTLKNSSVFRAKNSVCLDFGNRCGHDKNHPRLTPQNYTIKDNLPLIIRQVIENAKQAYFKRDELELFNRTRLAANSHRTSKRQIRSESAEAVIQVLVLLFANLDLVTMRIGNPVVQQKRFYLIDVAWIVEKTGLNENRVYRALDVLKRANLLKVKRRTETESNGLKLRFRARTAVRLLCKEAFEIFGISYKKIKKARSDAYVRLQAKLQARGISTAALRNLKYFNRKVRTRSVKNPGWHFNSKYFSRNETEILRDHFIFQGEIAEATGLRGEELERAVLERLAVKYID